MDWIGWAVLVWAALMLGGFFLVGYWVGQRKGARRMPEQPPVREVVPGRTPLADLMNDEYFRTAARPKITRTDTATYLQASAVSGEVLDAPVRGPRHVSTETVGIPVIDVRA